MELLAPAGSREAVIAAVQSGANAVYVGGTKFSARSSAKNFNQEELTEIINYCHLKNVKVHVAANTLIKENETEEFLLYMEYLNNSCVDAVIMQDIGMASVVLKRFPDLEIHASTQLTCASVESALFLEKMGFSRIVLARELNYKEIEKIVKATKVEIEVFVHGAICMSYSGQCLMSSIIGGRSGNRGQCAQPCRLPYNFLHNGKNIKKAYLLSPKDMCLIEHIKTLEEIGVDSLKIEGRLKRPEYVSQVVGVYRKYLDNRIKVSNEDKKQLLDAFNRSGFTDGYFVNSKGVSMMSYENPSNISENAFAKSAVERCIENKNFGKIPRRIQAKLLSGKPLQLKIDDNNENSVEVCGDIISELAVNRALDSERIKEQLEKLGNTPFISESCVVFCDDGITIPISEINNLRRNAVQLLIDKILQKKKRRHIDFKFDIENIRPQKLELTAYVKTKEQAYECIKAGIRRIYMSGKLIESFNVESVDIEFVQILPPVDKVGKNDINIVSDSVLISSFGQFKNDGKKYYAGHRLNVFNSYSLDLLKNFEAVTLSPELTLKEIKQTKKPCKTEIIGYGRLPLMVFENCPVKTNNMCDAGTSYNVLSDRKNEKFPLLCQEGCFCELYNSKPIYLADRINDIIDAGVRYLRLDFTVEDRSECEFIINQYIRALSGERVLPLGENTFTRGHSYNKTE